MPPTLSLIGGVGDEGYAAEQAVMTIETVLPPRLSKDSYAATNVNMFSCVCVREIGTKRPLMRMNMLSFP